MGRRTTYYAEIDTGFQKAIYKVEHSIISNKLITIGIKDWGNYFAEKQIPWKLQDTDYDCIKYVMSDLLVECLPIPWEIKIPRTIEEQESLELLYG